MHHVEKEFMKRLHFYIIKSFIGPFVMTFFIVIFVLIMQFLWRYLDDMVGKGLENSIILELLAYAAINMVPLALPLAMLLASIMTFGTLGERYELLAIKSSGVSLLRFMRPLIVLALLITLLAFYLADQVVTVTNSKFAALLTSVKQQRPEMIIKEGVFSNELDGYSIKVDRRNQQTNTLENIMIYDHTQGRGNVSVTLADSGYLNMSENKQYMILTLFNGESYNDTQPSSDRNAAKTHPFRRDKFKRQEIVIKVDGLELKRAKEEYFKDWYKMLTNKQLDSTIKALSDAYTEREYALVVSTNYNQRLNTLTSNTYRPDTLKAILDTLPQAAFHFDSLFNSLNEIDRKALLSTAQSLAQSNQRMMLQYESELSNKLKWINKHIIEWHRKYSLSVACLIFFFIGAPLGAIIRKGGFGMPVVVSILMFISYYLVSMIGEKVAREGVWDVGAAMWFSTVVYLPLGIFLTYQAVTDSMLMTSESYAKLIQRLNIFKHIPRGKKKQKAHENTGSLQ